jgi:prephenate dehydrogenase
MLSFYKVLILKELKQITFVGLGLLGGSIALTVLRTFTGVKTVGYSHRNIKRRE